MFSMPSNSYTEPMNVLEVGPVAGDRLDVRLKPGKLRLRGRLREVRLVVDRDHLPAGADREETLGRGRRQRDDSGRALPNLDGAVRSRDRDWERSSGLGSRGLARIPGFPTPAGGEHGDERHERKETLTHLSSFLEGNGTRARVRSSDSGLPLAPPSQPRPVASWRGSVSPYSGGTVPGSHPGPQPLAVCRAESSIGAW